MSDRDTLMTIAQIAATFVGFASVVFAVSRSAAGGGRGAECTALRNLLVPDSCVVFPAFVPIVGCAGCASAELRNGGVGRLR